jgi:Ricin-type beta-trefoil lectin domain
MPEFHKRIIILAIAAGSLLAVSAGPAKADPAVSNDAYGGVHIINHDGLCLGISGGKDDAPAGQFRCVTHPDQFWHWGTSSNGYKQLINGDGQCLGVAGGSDKYGARIVGWRCNGHPDQYWTSYLVNEGGTTWEDFANYDPLSNGDEAVLGIAGGSTKIGAAAVQWAYTAAANQLWHSE